MSKYKQINSHQFTTKHTHCHAVPDLSFLNPVLMKGRNYEENDKVIIQYGNVFDKSGKFLRREK